jgi:fibronectin-binding autotransporter adhesin
MSLVKDGPSTLTISQANTWSGGTTVSGGMISLANDTANASGLGTSDVSLSDGSLRMHSNGSSTSSAASYWNIDVPAGTTGTLETDARCELRGKLTGGGVFRFRLPAGSVRTSIFGDWSAFTGVVEATAMSGVADFRIAADYNWPGLPGALLSLGDGVTAYWAGNLNRDAGSFVNIGALAGSAASTLKGGNISGRQLTYRIGNRGEDATFAGTIGEQASGITNLTKCGSGTWTFSGNASINGKVGVEDGTLRLDGSLASAALVVSDGGTLGGHGGLAADLTNHGRLHVGSDGGLAVTGSLDQSGLLDFTASSLSATPLSVSGNLILNGGIRVELPPGVVFGRFPLVTFGGTLSGTPALDVVPAEIPCHLTSTANEVVLVIDDSDEDGLPDRWENEHFKDLDETADGDADGDGTSNRTEFRLGLDPTDGASAFRAVCSGRALEWPAAPGLRFTVKRNLTLDPDAWVAIAIVTAEGNTAAFTDPDTFERAFYRIELAP